MAEPKSRFELTLSFIQVMAIVGGVVVSLVNINATRVRELEARALESDKAFVELRRKVYLDAVQQAAILANQGDYSQSELDTARRRFRALYVAELTMVEDRGVEAEMVNLAGAVDPTLARLTPEQRAAYNLAKALKPGYISPRVSQP